MVAILAVVYIFLVTKQYRYYPVEKTLKLDDTGDKLLSNYYRNNVNDIISYDNTDTETASTLIKRLYNITIDPSLIVVGQDIDKQYYNETNVHLVNIASKDDFKIGTDCIIYIRDKIALEGEIAIIYNKRLCKKLFNHNRYDLSMVQKVINNNLDVIVNKYLEEVLAFRWNKLKELPLINSHGSYAYFKEKDFTFDNVDGYRDNNVVRINLLCSDIEFDTLIKRYVI